MDKEAARQRQRDYVRSTKSFYWGPTTKKGDVVSDGTNDVKVKDVVWKKPVQLAAVDPYGSHSEYIGGGSGIDPNLLLSTPHAKQQNVSLTGGHPGRIAHVPVEPKRLKTTDPCGP